AVPPLPPPPPSRPAGAGTRRSRVSDAGWYGLGGGAVRPMPPGVDAVLPELRVGEYPRVEDLVWLRDTHGVTAVLSLQDDADLASKRLRAADLEAACAT